MKNSKFLLLLPCCRAGWRREFCPLSPVACARSAVLNVGVPSGAQSTGQASKAGFHPVSVTNHVTWSKSLYLSGLQVFCLKLRKDRTRSLQSPSCGCHFPASAADGSPRHTGWTGGRGRIDFQIKCPMPDKHCVISLSYTFHSRNIVSSKIDVYIPVHRKKPSLLQMFSQRILKTVLGEY